MWHLECNETMLKVLMHEPYRRGDKGPTPITSIIKLSFASSMSYLPVMFLEYEQIDFVWVW